MIFLFEFELLQFSKCKHILLVLKKVLQSILSHCVSRKTVHSIPSGLVSSYYV